MSEIEQERQAKGILPDKAASIANPTEDATDELEWLNIIRNPGVQRELSRLAAEARQQYYAGEVEEDDFRVE